MLSCDNCQRNLSPRSFFSFIQSGADGIRCLTFFMDGLASAPSTTSALTAAARSVMGADQKRRLSGGIKVESSAGAAAAALSISTGMNFFRHDEWFSTILHPYCQIECFQSSTVVNIILCLYKYAAQSIYHSEILGLAFVEGARQSKQSTTIATTESSSDCIESR